MKGVGAVFLAGACALCGCSSVPIIEAARNGQVDLVRSLLDSGASCDPKPHRTTALMVAAANGHADVAQLLMEKDCPIDAQDFNDYTALMFAAMNGHIGVARLLLDAHADPGLVTSSDQTAAMLAKNNNHIEIARLIDSYTQGNADDGGLGGIVESVAGAALQAGAGKALGALRPVGGKFQKAAMQGAIQAAQNAVASGDSNDIAGTIAQGAAGGVLGSINIKGGGIGNAALRGAAKGVAEDLAQGQTDDLLGTAVAGAASGALGAALPPGVSKSKFMAKAANVANNLSQSSDSLNAPDPSSSVSSPDSPSDTSEPPSTEKKTVADMSPEELQAYLYRKTALSAPGKSPKAEAESSPSKSRPILTPELRQAMEQVPMALRPHIFKVNELASTKASVSVPSAARLPKLVIIQIKNSDAQDYDNDAGVGWFPAANEDGYLVGAAKEPLKGNAGLDGAAAKVGDWNRSVSPGVINPSLIKPAGFIFFKSVDGISASLCLDRAKWRGARIFIVRAAGNGLAAFERQDSSSTPIQFGLFLRPVAVYADGGWETADASYMRKISPPTHNL